MNNLLSFFDFEKLYYFFQGQTAVADKEIVRLIELTLDHDNPTPLIGLLGAHIVAPNAGDLIGETVLAIKFGLRVQEVVSMLHPYLTLGGRHQARRRALLAGFRSGQAVSGNRPRTRFPWSQRRKALHHDVREAVRRGLRLPVLRLSGLGRQ